MELLILISACKMGSARRITGIPFARVQFGLMIAVMPYFPYSKQSKMKKHRGAIVGKSIIYISKWMLTDCSDCKSVDNGRSQSCHHLRPPCLSDARLLLNPSRQSLCGTFSIKMDSRTHHRLEGLCDRSEKSWRRKTSHLPR